MIMIKKKINNDIMIKKKINNDIMIKKKIIKIRINKNNNKDD